MRVALQVLPGAAPALLREAGRAGVIASIPSGGDAELAEEVGLTLDRTPASLALLAGLRTAVAAWIVVPNPAPRPTGLVSTEALREVTDAFEAIAWQRPRVRFRALRLDAAGSHTPEMRRIAAEVAELAGVPIDDDDGDLAVRVRRTVGGGPGWELLIRTTARPLATRAWRTERYPGALNATLAAAVVDEMGVSPDDVFADLMCGSGTLLIERMARGQARRLLAVDSAPEAIATTTTHLRAARVRGRAELVCAPVAELGRGEVPPGAGGPLEGEVTVIVSNPPWGELLGEHATNASLYVELLDAVDRLGAPDVRAGILTHDIRRFEALLERDQRWRLAGRPQFFAKGHRPRLFLLERA